MKISKKVIFAAKVVVSLTLLYVILKDINFENFSEVAQNVDFKLLLAAYTLPYLGYILTAWRWKRLLDSEKIHISIGYLIRSLIVGVFFNQFLPSTVGGDSIRLIDTCKKTRNRASAISVLFTDRMVGLIALVSFSIIAVFFTKDLTEEIGILKYWVILATFGLIGILILALGASTKVLQLIPTGNIKFIEKIHGKVMKISHSLQNIGRNKRVLVESFGISVLLQLNVILFYYLISLAFGFNISALNFFVIVPMTLLVAMLPVSINGIGLRENALYFFLAPFAVSKPEAILFAWTLFSIQLLQGIIGGIVYAIRKN